MKNKFWGTDIVILILTILSVTFAVAFGLTQPKLMAVVCIAIGIIIFVLYVNIHSVKKMIRGIFAGTGKQSSNQQLNFEHLKIPVAIISRKSVVWYNEEFRDKILSGDDCFLTPLSQLLPEFDIEQSSAEKGYSIEIGDKEYTVYSSSPTQDNDLWVSYFVDDTKLKFEAREYHCTRPIVLEIVVDTYDEVLKELKESKRALITAKLDQMIEDISQECSGLSMKIGPSRYHIVIEDRYFSRFYNSNFDILTKAKNMDEENVTLSIGVGKGGKDFAENELLARQALDMALGRGGDQAVIKNQDGYEFFGGLSRSVEKRSKVRSRIVAKALKDIIVQSDNVLIMGHKMSDLDSVGAAVGVCSAAKILDRKAGIVVNEDATLALNLIEWVKSGNGDEDIFIHPDKANSYVNSNTLLVIVDTHTARMTEHEELCKKCKKKVVIDHHRRMVDYITDTVVSYHEPYASSASELVTELIQYILPSDAKLSPKQAGALLSGIMLDTHNFTEKAGVRTFEAASYLRRQGAEPNEILKLFAIPKDIYIAKSELVARAQSYRGVAVSMSENISNDSMVAVPQAANDLLMLEGIDASIVAVKFDDKISISARSLGEINVQVLMEYLGGGGHLTMAGAQLYNMELEEAQKKIYESIDNYRR